jgi:GNAT superfamily N-acetyltransferase
MLSKAPSTARVRIRPIRADDRDELSLFYATLSPESRLARFHAVSRGINDDAATLLCGPDHEHREGFIAEPAGAASGNPGNPGIPGNPRIVGHLCLEPSDSGFEMAVAVADDWQAQGIGRELLLAAVDWATSHGIERLQASALSSNSAVLGLIASIGRPVRESMSTAGVVEVTIHIGGTRLNAA